MPPSLDGAQSWLDRAEEHLRDLSVLLDLMFEAEREAVLATAHVGTYRDGAGEFGYKRSPLVSAPRRVSVILGETIQALKRSLDYVVYELAFLDSGSEQNDTQFPIDSSPETFRRRLKRDSPAKYRNSKSDQDTAGTGGSGPRPFAVVMQSNNACLEGSDQPIGDDCRRSLPGDLRGRIACKQAPIPFA